MCKWGTNSLINKDILPLQFKKYASPGWIENHGGIPVDSCIKDEIEHLIKNGVITLGCCCGHFEAEPECIIHKQSIELVKTLGYDPVKYRPGEIGFENRYEIILKIKGNQIK